MSGRRATDRARGGDRALLAVGAVLVAAALGLAMLVRPVGEEPAARASSAPTEADLTRADLACPPGAGELAITSLRGETGRVTRTSGADEETVRLRKPGLGLAPAGEEASVITARAELAPGLLAGGAGRVAAPCVAPRAQTWFTGATARSDRPTSLQLVNPDRGAGFVDVQVLTESGELAVPGLRGLRVPGRGTTTVQLAEAVPQEQPIALGVRVTRGRVGALVRAAEVDPETGRESSVAWLAGQPEPEAATELLGVPEGSGARTLVLANPGDSETAVEVRVATRDSTFAPEGLEPVRVPPGSVRTVSLDEVLAGTGEERVSGVVLSSGSPVIAGLRSVVDGDLALTAPAESLAEVSGAVLPTGAGRRLVVDGATERTVVEVRILTRRGVVRTERLSVLPGRATELALPPTALAVRLEAPTPGLRAAVAISGAGRDLAGAVGLVSPAEHTLVPTLR